MKIYTARDVLETSLELRHECIECNKRQKTTLWSRYVVRIIIKLYTCCWTDLNWIDWNDRVFFLRYSFYNLYDFFIQILQKNKIQNVYFIILFVYCFYNKHWEYFRFSFFLSIIKTLHAPRWSLGLRRRDG